MKKKNCFTFLREENWSNKIWLKKSIMRKAILLNLFLTSGVAFYAQTITTVGGTGEVEFYNYKLRK